MRYMEKIGSPAILIILVLLIIGIISVDKIAKRAEIRVAEKDLRVFLEELDGLMEYSLPEGWEIKKGSAVARYNGNNEFSGDVSIGIIGIDDGEWIEDCIRMCIYYNNTLTIGEIRNDLELNFGDSDDYYTFETVRNIDGEEAYYGTRVRDNIVSKEIHMVHDRWSVDLYLTSEWNVLDEHVNALYEFAESIDFK